MNIVINHNHHNGGGQA